MILQYTYVDVGGDRITNSVTMDDMESVLHLIKWMVEGGGDHWFRILP